MGRSTWKLGLKSGKIGYHDSLMESYTVEAVKGNGATHKPSGQEGQANTSEYKKPSGKSTWVERVERRMRLVAEWIIDRKSPAYMAKRLNISRGRVARLIQQTREHWVTASTNELRSALYEELARLERDEKKVRKLLASTIEIDIKGELKEIPALTARERLGCFAQLLEYSKHRMKLLGLEDVSKGLANEAAADRIIEKDSNGKTSFAHRMLRLSYLAEVNGDFATASKAALAAEDAFRSIDEQPQNPNELDLGKPEMTQDLRSLSPEKRREVFDRMAKVLGDVFPVRETTTNKVTMAETAEGDQSITVETSTTKQARDIACAFIGSPPVQLPSEVQEEFSGGEVIDDLSDDPEDDDSCDEVGETGVSA